MRKHFAEADPDLRRGSWPGPHARRLKRSSHAWLSLPRFEAAVPSGVSQNWDSAWLQGVKSLHALGMVKPEDFGPWQSPGQVFETVVRRWFDERTAGCDEMDLQVLFVPAAEMAGEGMIEEPSDEKDIADLGIWIEVPGQEANFRVLQRGYEHLDALHPGLGAACTTILSSAGSRIGFVFDVDYLCEFAGCYLYGWDGGRYPGCFEPDEQADNDSEFTMADFAKDHPKPELLNPPKWTDSVALVEEVAGVAPSASLILADVVELVRILKSSKTGWPDLGGTDYYSMYPAFSLAWNKQEPGDGTGLDTIYRAWDDFENMLHGGSEGFTYGLGGEIFAASTPRRLRATLKRWDSNLQLLRATNRLLKSMTDPF